MRNALLLIIISFCLLSCKKEPFNPFSEQSYIAYKIGERGTDVIFYTSEKDIMNPDPCESCIVAVTDISDYDNGTGIRQTRMYSESGEYWRRTEYGGGYAYIKILNNEPVRLQVLVNEKVIYDETKKNNFFERALTKDDFLP